MTDKVQVPTLQAGTIVLQYINDDRRCVGVVVDNRFIDHVNEDERWRFRKPDEHHICMVLGWFTGYKEPWSLFDAPMKRTFPTYVVGEKASATPCDLTEELELLKIHDADKSLGLNYNISLRRNIFGFNAKVVEALALVSLTKHFLGGGNLGDWLQGHPYLGDNNAKAFIEELQKIFPR